MKAKLNSELSWLFQKVFILENGWKVFVSNSCWRGETVSSLWSPEGKVWFNELGIDGGADKWNEMFQTNKYVNLPDFAKSWVEVVGGRNLIRPKFIIE